MGINELKEKIDDIKKQLPKHSIPPAMLLELEDLEENLERALIKIDLESSLNAQEDSSS
jgi:SMC interacting uncharacterized protein involved in chromosome segregation